MSKNNKILILIDSWFPYLGGGPVHVWELSKRLALQYDYQITILTRKLPGDNSKIPVVPAQLKNKLKVITLGPIARWDNLFIRIWYLASAFLMGLRLDTDLIHVHAFSPCLIGRLLGWLKRRPVIMTVHGTRLLTDLPMGHGLLDRIFFKLEKLTILKIKYDFVISVDQKFLLLPNINTNIAVIPNGVTLKGYKEKKSKKSLGFQLIFVGRLVAQKGLKMLLNAISVAKEDCPHLKLVIIGDGPERKNLENITLKENLQDIVTFVGEKTGEGLKEYYENSQGFILPSLYEGQSLALLDAMAAGLAVIATDVGASSSLVQQGITGYLVPPNDANALASVIIQLGHEPDKNEMGQAGCRLVRKKYSWEVAVKLTHKVYQEALV